jgi:hypothetical protein
MSIPHLLITLIFFHLHLGLEFQVRKASPAKTSSQSEVQTSQSVLRPFDISVDKLPPGFKGLPIKLIFEELETRSARVKGEFETTEEFQARTQREANAPVLGSLPIASSLAFRVKNTSGESVYDADNKLMTVAIALSTPKKGVSSIDTMRALTVDYELQKSSYEASNAYGAKTQVEKHTGKDYDLAFNNYDDFEVVKYIDTRTKESGYSSDIFARDTYLVKIPMDIPTAKRVKEHLSILAVTRLVAPYTFEGAFYKKPTMNSPDEYFVQYYQLNTDLLEVWVYDETTGEVFAKLKPKQRLVDSPTPAALATAPAVPCMISPTKRPELRGFYLGMSFQEVKSKAGSLTYGGNYADKNGISTMHLMQHGEGTSGIDLEFLDEKLISVIVTYDSSVNWSSSDEYFAKIAEGLGITNNWKRAKYDDSGRIDCDGFAFEAEYRSGIIPRLKMYDTNAPAIIKKREAEREEQKKKQFRP